MSWYSGAKDKVVSAVDFRAPVPGEDVFKEADEITLQRIDEANAVVRPPELGVTYLEAEFDERADEQLDLFTAEGERLARPHTAEAAGQAKRADDEDHAVVIAKELADTTKDQYLRALVALCFFVVRGPKQKALFWPFVGVLFFGDVVGISGAAIYLGEIPTLAFFQAISVGAAAVASGFLAAELKELRQARERQKGKLSEEEKPYAHFFNGDDATKTIVKVVLIGGLGIVALIAGGVFALRSATEGSTAGFVFGCLAAAVALGSWCNTYAYADRVADFLDHLERRASKALKHLIELSQGPARYEYAKRSALAESIRTEYKARGAAAKRRLQAAKNRALRNSPGVVGHGPARASNPPKPTLSLIDGASSNGHDTDEKQPS